MKVLGLNFFDGLPKQQGFHITLKLSKILKKSNIIIFLRMNMTLDEDEIKTYIGAINFMSISPVCQLSHYWSNNEYVIEDLGQAFL